MPAAWQKWMPIYIQRLKSNPYVIAMHPAAVTGYLWLVMEQWQSEDCTLTNNVKELKIISSLGMYWADYADEILDRFGSVNGDRLRNDTCYELWMEAKAKYEEGQLQYEALKEQRSRYGKHGAEVREARRLVTNHARHKQDLSTPEATLKQDSSTTEAPLKQDLSIADAKSCFTDTYTVTNTSKELLLASHPSGDSAEIVFEKLPTNRKGVSFEVFESHVDDWMGLYPAVDARQQVRNMRGWLDGNPEHRKTLKGTPAFIHRWLSKAQDKGGFSGSQPGSTGSIGLTSPASQRVASGVNAFRQAGERFGLTAASGANGADGSPLSASGHRAGSGELPVRHAALTGEARISSSGDGATHLAHKAGPEILPPSIGSSGGVRGYGN